jgi:hypothetical protein
MLQMVTLDKVKKAKADIETAVNQAGQRLTLIRTDLERPLDPEHEITLNHVRTWHRRLDFASDFTREVMYAILHALGGEDTQDMSPEVVRAKEDALNTKAQIDKRYADKVAELDHLQEVPPDFKRDMIEWIKDITRLTQIFATDADIYLVKATVDQNKRVQEKLDVAEKGRQEAWEADPRAVLPVSEYGKSNIGEAFAEVFAHYVLGADLTRDQLESFRSVLSSEDDVLARIVRRFLAGCQNPKLLRT